MARLATIKWNDATNGVGICVSVWMQGCPFHCEECHNPETWDFCGGQAIPWDIADDIYNGLIANNLQRDLSILGGEPLCPENIFFVNELVGDLKARLPHLKVYLWTGYTFETLKNRSNTDIVVQSILDKVDVLIDGPFIKEKKDFTLKLRGSSNQHIREKRNNKWYLME